MKDQLEKLKNEAEIAIKEAQSQTELDSIQTDLLGRKAGKLNEILKGLKDLPVEEKKEIGPLANKLRGFIEELFATREQALAEAAVNTPEEWLDISLPGNAKNTLGSIHPIAQVQREVEDHMQSMGFAVIDGPQVDSDYYNFQALNIPEHHPARDMFDTLWLENGYLMRTHTSSTQARVLEKHGVPMRAIVPGVVFRQEDLDACHEHTFGQIEGLMVDKHLTIANLIATMKEVLRGVFRTGDIEVRLRPGYFPFVEPGFELDMRCLICGGVGCSACKHSGWLEVLPCGPIHPNVLEAAGIDSNEYNGFAFALGLDRIVMMRHEIGDIREFRKNDLRFLKQF